MLTTFQFINYLKTIDPKLEVQIDSTSGAIIVASGVHHTKNVVYVVQGYGDVTTVDQLISNLCNYPDLQFVVPNRGSVYENIYIEQTPKVMNITFHKNCGGLPCGRSEQY